MDSKEFINNIRNRQIESDKEYMLDSLAGGIDRLQKAFPRYGSFLMEFVQNADDACSSSLKIEILNNQLLISNNGLPFEEENVKSICKVGRSSKTPKDYIGYLGVGFKSVFLISESPEIHSGNYHFKFSKKEWVDAIHTPWQIIPIWIENPSISNNDEYKTKFLIPLKELKLLDKIKEEVSPFHLNDRILLFLRHVKEIHINNSEDNKSRTIKKSDNLSENKEYEIYQIEEYENENLKNKDRWLLFRSECDVPSEVKEDYVTKEWERDNIEKREVLVALKLNEENKVLIEKEGTAHIGVFSFLPLKEIPSGLNFLIHADFLTNPGRGELARECQWNNWLASEIYGLITSKVIPISLKHELWRMNITEVLYSNQGGHELFEKNIKEPLREYLENNSVLIAEDGSTAKADEVISMTLEVKSLFTEEDLKLIYPDKKIIHNNCKPNNNLEIEKVPSDIYYFISSQNGEKLIKHKSEIKDVNWFKNLYLSFVTKYTHAYFVQRYARYNVEYDDFWNRMHHFDKPIILTEDFEVVKINECYINSKNIKLPSEIKEKFKIVHSDIIKDENFKIFIKKLNEDRYHYVPPTSKVIRELSEEDIKNYLKEQETLGLNKETWETFSDEVKIEKIKHLKKLWEKKFLSLSGYNFLTIKTKGNRWVKPEQVIFSKEYKPEHNLEIISIDKGLCDIPLEFLNNDFIQGKNDDEIKKFFRFFEELGVDKLLMDKEFRKNLVQRIGILVALRYEEINGRKSKELSRSEETGGHDIHSQEETEEEGLGQIESEERYIEVKGRRQSSPDIFLTTKQYRTLQKRQDKYYVYLVKDAFKYPTLCVNRGDKLFEITDTKIIIPFSKWSKEAKEDEYRP